MTEILELIVPWVVTSMLMFTLLAWDERRLAPEAQGRAWPQTTRAIAVVCFGPLALPVHFARTRRTVLGFLQGVAWAAAAALLSELLAEGTGELVGSLTPGSPR